MRRRQTYLYQTQHHYSGAIVAHSDDAMLVITVAVVLEYLTLALLAVRD